MVLKISYQLIIGAHAFEMRIVQLSFRLFDFLQLSLSQVSLLFLRTMLRLAPTQIGIGSRDLTWHTERHEARQSRRADGYPVEVIGSPDRAVPVRTDRVKFNLPHRFARPLSIRKTSTNSVRGADLISKDPVPRGSRIFWDNILADAGTPSGIKVQNVGRRPRIIEQSDELQGNARSTEASLEGGFNTPTEADYASLFDITSPHQQSKKADVLHSSFSSEYNSACEYNENNRELPGNDFHGKTQFDLPIRSSSLLLSPGGTRQEDSIIGPRGLFYRKDMDSCPDSLPYHRRNLGANADSDTPESNDMVAESFGPFSLPQLPFPRVVENFRRRSNGLPRSPLYISQAVASSSPEKRPQAFINDSDEDVTQSPSLLNRPPRRRKTYKPRSESYPFDVSEKSLSSSYADDNSENGETGYLSAEESSPKISPPEHDVSDQGGSISSSPIPKLRPSPARSKRNTSPYSFRSLRTPIALPPLPPRPFSATQRTTSGTIALPASPITPLSSPPPSPTRSSPSTTPRRFRIYNDRLPASSQPRTPARLSRNGLPHMPHGIGIEIQTAPAGNGRQRRGSNGVASTPTRRRGRTTEDQENLGLGAEISRRLIMDRGRGERLLDYLDAEEDDAVLD